MSCNGCFNKEHTDCDLGPSKGRLLALPDLAGAVQKPPFPAHLTVQRNPQWEAAIGDIPAQRHSNRVTVDCLKIILVRGKNHLR